MPESLPDLFLEAFTFSMNIDDCLKARMIANDIPNFGQCEEIEWNF